MRGDVLHLIQREGGRRELVSGLSLGHCGSFMLMFVGFNVISQKLILNLVSSRKVRKYSWFGLEKRKIRVRGCSKRASVEFRI